MKKQNVCRLGLSKGFLGLCLSMMLLNYQTTQASSLNESSVVVKQQIMVRGQVVDNKGVPLPGVSVLVKGKTGKGVATDFDGNYSIEVSTNDVLVFSYVGFATQEISVKGKSTINVTLKEDAQELGEVVVVGFGKQKKVNLTGSVAVVGSEAFEDRPVSNAAQALQGQVAGMNFDVGKSGTELGGKPSFNVRGTGTIGQGSSSDPLVLIDGVEGDLSAVNPQDIENISVLKDAASSSIYGSRAAFGVILVTTKSGKEGKLRVNYSQNYRISMPTIIPSMMDSENFAYYMNDALINDGNKPRFKKALIDKIIAYKNGDTEDGGTAWRGNQWRSTDSWANTDWYKVYFRDWAPSQEHNLSLSGGSKKTNYYISGNFLSQEGLIRFNTDTFDRYSLTGKFSSQVNNWFKVGYTARYVRSVVGKSSYITGSHVLYHNIARKWPITPVYDPNGHLMFSSDIPKVNMGRDTQRRDVLTQQVNLTFSPIKDWNTYVNLTYRTQSRYGTRYFKPVYSYDQEGLPIVENPDFNDKDFGRVRKPGMSGVSESSISDDYFSPNVYSEYSLNLNEKHFFKTMVGFQMENFIQKNLSLSRDQMLVDDIVSISTTTGKNTFVNGNYFDWATAGFFGRLNYDYKGKYLVELNVRYDGTSRFLRDQRWNWYPSASLGWNVANESFWEKLKLSEVSVFKLRASYGELGNQSTSSPYPFFQNIDVYVDKGPWLINNLPTNIALTPKLVSSSLTWEKVSTLNFGLDVVALRNRLDLSLDVFSRRTYDMVGPAPKLPAVFGTRVPVTNNTDMVSNGFELAIGWKDRVNNNFNYSVRASLTDSRQKILKYPNEIKNLKGVNDGKIYYAGQYLGEIWGYSVKGIARNEQQMTDWLVNHNQTRLGDNWAAGDLMYEDLDGNKLIDSGDITVANSGDLKIIGDGTPRYNFGLDISMKYKAVDFRIFFQGTAKREVYLGTGNLFAGFNQNIWQSSAFEQHLDYFRPEGTASPLGSNTNSYFTRPQIKYGQKNFNPMGVGFGNSYYLQNAAYVRIKNLQIGYNVPKKIISSIGMSAMRVYFSAENLATWTNLIDIFDPEAISGYAGSRFGGQGKMYPMSRVFSTGLNITF